MAESSEEQYKKAERRKNEKIWSRQALQTKTDFDSQLASNPVSNNKTELHKTL